MAPKSTVTSVCFLDRRVPKLLLMGHMWAFGIFQCLAEALSCAPLAEGELRLDGNMVSLKSPKITKKWHKYLSLWLRW